MNRTTIAIMLCAGSATRMRPLSLNCPKALLPFCGRPLLEYTLDQLRESKIAETIIVAGIHDIGFEQYATLEPSDGMKIRIVRYGPEHGTGGILKEIVKSIGIVGEPVLAIYGDSLLKMDFRAILSAHKNNEVNGCRATVVWHKPDDLILSGKTTTNYGILWLGESGQCVRFVEKPVVAELTSHCASTAVFVLERDFLLQLPNDRPADLSVALLSKFATGTTSPVFGYQLIDGYRFDIGTISDYASRQFAALDGVIPVNNVSRSQQHFGDEVKLGSGTKLHGHNIFGNHVTIGENCQLTDCVVLEGTEIGNRVKLTGVVLGRSCKVQDNMVLMRGTILGDYCVVG